MKGVQTLGCVSELFHLILRIWIAAGVLPGRARQRRLHLPKMSKLKQDVFDKAHEKAVAATTRKRPRQCSYNDLDTIRITSMPTVLQLLQMYKQVHNLFVKHSAALIPRNVSFAKPDGGIPTTFKADFLDGVPVALPFDEQNLSFFILEVITDDNAVFQFPMRLDSLYCCGFRCLDLCDNPLEKLWYSFGKVSLLPKRLFKNRKKSGLSLAYNNFRKIQIFAGVIAKFCDHFRGFRPVDSADDDLVGQQLKDTLFFIFSEACRFWFAMCVTVKGFQSETAAPVRLTDLMGDLIQDYGDTSRLGGYLWLAFLEKTMELAATCLHDPGRFPDLLLAFATEAKNFVKYTEADPEFDNQPLIKFKRSSDDLCLGALDGESLFIVKYSCVLIRKALMRDAAYARIFPVMEPISGEDVDCYDD